MGRTADAAITVGLVGASAAAVTGLADWSKVGRGRPRRIGLVHGLLNICRDCLLYHFALPSTTSFTSSRTAICDGWFLFRIYLPI